MVQSNRRPHWIEAAQSAFAIASALPTTALNSMQIAELFEKVEQGQCDSSLNNSEVLQLRNASGETLLIVAAKVNNVEAVKVLVSLSVSEPEAVDETDNEGWSALLNAAHRGHYEVVKILLENGASVDLPDLMGWSPLMWAVYKNQPDILATLLQYRAHVNLIDEEDGLTPLIVAAGRGFITVVTKLLEFEAQVNACDKFGSTALIWASRKGYLPVVEALLAAGAEVDAVGMYSCTALMMATRGNCAPVVDILLSREPNINVADQNGLTALGIAAREGYTDICESLVHAGAFVNQADRFGNWILTSAVRSGCIPIVKLLLDKFADVNCKDADNRTPLHLAIDKSFTDMAQLILEKKPNLEIKNKDGETPLIRAVKCRHIALVMLIRRAGAKLSPTDNNGDNALHLALRARSRRLAQALLENAPVAEKRLLYRPNKGGQTAYAIDMENPQPILPLLYGPKQADQQMDGMMGYDVYSNVLADIVCEPALSLPLTIGLYAKWGSGKSILLTKLKDAMIAFSRKWTEGARMRLSILFIFYVFFSCLIWTMTVATFVALSKSTTWYVVVWIIGGTICVGLLLTYGLLWYGSEYRGWGAAISLGTKLAKAFSYTRLLWSVLTMHAPIHDEADLASNPVSFLFADYHRLSSIGGEQALAKILTTLIEAAEEHYGVLPVRLFNALRITKPGQHGYLRRVLGIPTIILFLLTGVFLILGEFFVTLWLFSERNSGDTLWITLGITFLAIFLVMVIYPLVVLIRFGWQNIPRLRVNQAARNVTNLKLEGLMQSLQNEVDLLAEMVKSLDAFTSSQTRLVVIVDGLDNCEQDKMVQTLDAIELLFSARENRPIISIIAVDPHIIVAAINHNMHSALAGTELTGYDFLKNIINMPFFLHNSAIRQLHSTLKDKRESLAEWKERFRRQETFYGSYVSLKEAEGGRSRKQTLVVPPNSKNIGEALTDDYFSNMNPRAIRRIVNSLTLSGRLMRAFEIEFSWLSLGHWVSLLEQWPTRLCWIIDRALDISNNSITLAEVYLQMKDRIPKIDSLLEYDRNASNFESFLTSPAIPSSEQLTVGHVKKYLACTSNLDPYLRKLIHEKRVGLLDPVEDLGFGMIVLPPNAKFLFPDEKSWNTVCTPLVEMSVDDVIALIRRLKTPPVSLEIIVKKFQTLNLNGLVLASASFNDVRDALNINLGDWTMIKLLLETLKAFGTNVPGLKIERKKEPTLKEEEEDEEEEDEGRDRNLTIVQAPPGVVEQRRRSVVMNKELNSDHKWLMESLSGMDLIETEGDLEIDANSTSVRFDDEREDVASEADSIESRIGSWRGSRENLLEPVELSRHSSSNGRGEILAGMHKDSIHSQGEGLSVRSSLLSIDDDEHQQTVKRRDNEEKEKAISQLRNLFSQNSDGNQQL